MLLSAKQSIRAVAVHRLVGSRNMAQELKVGAKMQAAFKPHEPGAGGVDKADFDSRWEGMWAAGLQPGQAFDQKGPSPALVDALATGAFTVAGKRVLVPGCGRGYDVVLFAQNGAKLAHGLEISTTAVKAAQDYISSKGVSSEVAQVIEGDFFSHTEAPFDLGLDYTFGCAIHPSMREGWGTNWARHIAPGGELVTLIYPVKPDAPADVGPPFPVSLELYASFLKPHGFTLKSAAPVTPELSHPGRGGFEFLALWSRNAQ